MIDPKIDVANEKLTITINIINTIKNSDSNANAIENNVIIETGTASKTLKYILLNMTFFALIGNDFINQKFLPSKDKDMADV